MVRLLQTGGSSIGKFEAMLADLRDRANIGDLMAVIVTDPAKRSRIKAVMTEYPNVTVISGEQEIPEGAHTMRIM